MERKTNTCAVVGFILSFFCGFAGLIISIIALNQIKKTGEKGKGLAIAGIVITIISMVISLFIGVFYSVFVVPGLHSSIEATTICNNRPGITIGRYGEPGYVSCTSKSYDGTYVCNYTNGDGYTKTVTCQG